MRVALTCIATGKYIRFVQPLMESARQFFLAGHELVLVALTDSTESIPGVNTFPVEHGAWPLPTLLRYHYLHGIREFLRDRADYVYHCDADMLMVSPIDEEDVIGDRVATLHPSFLPQPRSAYTYEHRPESSAYVSPSQGLNYFAGGFNGGRTDIYLGMVEALRRNINTDLGNRIVAAWHDESHLNRFYVWNRPTKMLSPSYCHTHWAPICLEYPAKIVLVDKDMTEIRT